MANAHAGGGEICNGDSVKEEKPIVFIESPYSSKNGRTVEENLEYARACMLDSLNRGEIPVVSHLMWTQVWDDTDPEIRETALMLCKQLRERCGVVAFYTDLGWSNGMIRGESEARTGDVTIHYRKLEKP